MKKIMRMFLVVVVMTILSAFTALAAGWTEEQNGTGTGWRYDLGNGQYYAGTEAAPSWQWLDGNQDGVAECYAFDASGWMYANTVTPDGYQVDADGKWVVDSLVQSREVSESSAQTDITNTGNVLVVYFSKTGTTAQAAAKIQEHTGAALVSLEAADPYPDSYQAALDRAQREQSQDARPALTTTIPNMEVYDTVFVGYPIWYGMEPKLIDTFLESYDFSGKTIVPFCTSGSSGIDSSVRSIRSICPDSNVLSGRRVNDTGSIASWLREIGF
ncbi:MAG: flavodoxin [Lachnospiraceae bacterium]|nr:flavodoxin [Lachnospiraceae bacterium]